MNSIICKSYLYAIPNLHPTFCCILANIYMIDLVGTWAIMNAFGYDLSPALHIAEAKVIELLSGTSSAQFLMVFLTSEALSFHQSHGFTPYFEEEYLKSMKIRIITTGSRH